MRNVFSFLGCGKSGLLAVSMMLLIFHSGWAQSSRLHSLDTINLLDENLRTLCVEDSKQLERRVLMKDLRQHFNLKSVHCMDGFIRDGLKYIFFHTDVKYPVSDELKIWDVVFQLTSKLANSRSLTRGCYVRKQKAYYVLEKSVSQNGRDSLMRFIFFELDGQLAVLIYECDKAELFDRLPVQISLTHHHNEMRIPISNPDSHQEP